MPMVITIVTAAVTSIAYLIITLLPQLQDEQKKTQDKINYSIFFSSLNDYVVHAIRERWCVNKISYNGGILETDLLLSNECSSNVGMEKIVTFEGNLERILWDSNTIGQDNDPPDKNTIMGLFNQKKFLSNPDPKFLQGFDVSVIKKMEMAVKSNPVKVPVTFPLTSEKVKVDENGMRLRLSESVLQNMNDQHPLFVIARNIRRCIKHVDIVIKKDQNSTAEEVKLSINIEGEIANTLACSQTIKTATSTTHYTFFPRRLHTFSLVKYGDLKADFFHEYHGPVYVAGNLILPPESFEKARSSAFYNSLTLGVYNEGVNSGKYYGGKIKLSNKEDYTFEERGDPYLSKQDQYPGFRGILGGLRLDSSEDKGISKIFSHYSGSAADISTLEACIDENQVKTKPSFTAGTVLGYQRKFASSSDTTILFGMSRKNRFKPRIEAPKALSAGVETDKFLASMKEVQDGSQAIGEVKLDYGEGEVSFSVGENAVGEFTLNYSAFGITKEGLEESIVKLSSIKKDNYLKVIETVQTLQKSDEYENYIKRAEKVMDKCSEDAVSACTQFGFTETCTANCPNYSSFIDKMNEAKSKLSEKLQDLAGIVSLPATLTVKTDGPTSSGKKVINQRILNFEFSASWHSFIKKMAGDFLPKSLLIEFSPYHYSSDKDLQASLVYNTESPGSALKLKKKNGAEDSLSTSSSSWTNSANNQSMASNEIKELVELECPDGMSLADWNQDMSESTNFAWNYANTPAGAEIEEAVHEDLQSISFGNDLTEGHVSSHTKSVVEECRVKKEREKIFGFYACKNLIIEAGRSKPLYMIGTFIVENIINENKAQPVYWHSVWDEKASGLILTDYFKKRENCKTLVGKTWKNILGNANLKNDMKRCSAIDLVTNGPNNFTWTTVDPDIGLLPGHTMTSQKVQRVLRWVIREDSRLDVVR